MSYICTINKYKMVKYIKTVENIKGDTRNIILRFDRCNDCPMMRFNPDKTSVKCSIYHDNNGDDSIEDFIWFFKGERILQKINIPTWCKLPNNTVEANLQKKTYVKVKNSFIISYLDIKNQLPIVNSENYDIINDEDFNFLDYLHKETNEIEEPFNTEFDSIIDDINQFKGGYKPTHYTKSERCSLCGEEDDTVLRCVNNGMCETCFKLYSNNIDKVHIAYVNNFRMKRGFKKIDKNFKKIEQ